MDLQSLKSFDPAGYSVEEMVLMLATASAMIVSYKALGFEPPEWVVECEGKLTKEIKSRQRDAIEQELKELAGREEALKTATEKREDLGAKRKRLEEQRAKLG